MDINQFTIFVLWTHRATVDTHIARLVRRPGQGLPDAIFDTRPANGATWVIRRVAGWNVPERLRGPVTPEQYVPLTSRPADRPEVPPLVRDMLLAEVEVCAQDALRAHHRDPGVSMSVTAGRRGRNRGDTGEPDVLDAHGRTAAWCRRDGGIAATHLPDRHARGARAGHGHGWAGTTGAARAWTRATSVSCSESANRTSA
jgi:hypothetical protein